jgi:hypothetical protein
MKSETGPKVVILAPAASIPQILENAHGHLLSGHDGVLKTKERILQDYYWPGMDKDINEHITRCQKCQKRKPNRNLPELLSPLPQPTEPNQRIHADLFGPLKTTEKGKRYILCMTDAFTKYVELVAIPDKEAVTVASAFFNRWICRYGTPGELITDKGKEFLNELSKELFALLDLKHKTTAARHPQCNSQAEVCNKTIAKYLASYVSESTLDWEIYLPPLMFAYNTSYHRSIKNSPYVLTYGIQPRTPFFSPEDIRKIHYGENLPTELFQRLQTARKIAMENNMDATEKAKEYFDKKAHHQEFAVGQKVLLEEYNFLGKNTKLAPKFAGPYEITDVRGHHNLELKLANGKRIIVNNSRVKNFISDSQKQDSKENFQESEQTSVNAENEKNSSENNDAQDSTPPLNEQITLKKRGRPRKNFQKQRGVGESENEKENATDNEKDALKINEKDALKITRKQKRENLATSTDNRVTENSARRITRSQTRLIKDALKPQDTSVAVTALTRNKKSKKKKLKDEFTDYSYSDYQRCHPRFLIDDGSVPVTSESESESDSESDPENDPGYGGSSPIQVASDDEAEPEEPPPPLEPIPEEPEQVPDVEQAIEPELPAEPLGDPPEVRFNMNILDYYQLSAELKEAIGEAQTPAEVKELKEQAKNIATPIKERILKDSAHITPEKTIEACEQAASLYGPIRSLPDVMEGDPQPLVNPVLQAFLEKRRALKGQTPSDQPVAGPSHGGTTRDTPKPTTDPKLTERTFSEASPDKAATSSRWFLRTPPPNTRGQVRKTNSPQQGDTGSNPDSSRPHTRSQGPAASPDPIPSQVALERHLARKALLQKLKR